MIRTMDEVEQKFDAIKDHKPKASKKLAELGDILASAYKLEPDRADEMWQYIVELNIPDDIKNSKFYIAQVYNKVIDLLHEEDAVALVSMHPERVRLMMIYGYDGGTMFRCAESLIRGSIINGDTDGAASVIEYYCEKMEENNPESMPLSYVGTFMGAAFEFSKENTQYKQQTADFLDKLKGNLHDEIDILAKIYYGCITEDFEGDIESLAQSAAEFGFAKEALSLLWYGKDELDKESATDIWNMVVENNEARWIPMPDLQNDSKNYEGSKMQWYVNLIYDNDELLEKYFTSGRTEDFHEYIIRTWIVNDDWDRFTKYIAKDLMNTEEDEYGMHMDYLWRHVDYFLDAYFNEDNDGYNDQYKLSPRVITDDNLQQALEALDGIVEATVGINASTIFESKVNDFKEKLESDDEENDSDDVDEEQQEADIEAAKEKYYSVIDDFLLTGEQEYKGEDRLWDLRHACDRRYTGSTTIKIDMTDAIKKVLYKALAESGQIPEDYLDQIEDEPEEEEEPQDDTPKAEEYIEACKDDVAEFYFKHCAHESSYKAELLSSCIWHNDISRAIELVDMMIETSSYENFHERNSWEMELKNTLTWTLREFNPDERSEYSDGEVTDEMISQIVQLFEMTYPLLEEDTVRELKNAVQKVIPMDESESSEYIDNLLADLQIYTTYPKPRGYGGAPTVNRISQELMQSFGTLFKMGRMDVICKIFERFLEVQGQLKPITLEGWVSHFTREVPGKACAELFREEKDVLDAWLDSPRIRDWDILRFAEKMGEDCSRDEFIAFRDFVVSRHGKVDGLMTCFKGGDTEEELGDTTLFDGETVLIKFAGIEEMGNRGEISCIDIKFISTAKVETDDCVTVRLLGCKINGELVSECGFIMEMDQEPEIGYRIYSDDSEDELSIYSDFFDENPCGEIRKVELQFVVMDDEGNKLETMSEIVIELDEDRGLHEITQKAESKEVFYQNFESSEDESEEDEDYSDDDTDNDTDEFEDITFYNENDIRIDFCGIEFDEDAESMNLSFWFSNRTDELRKFYVKDITVNGEKLDDFSIIGDIESEDNDFVDFEVTGDGTIDYEDIESIVFSVEIDNDDCDALDETRKIRIKCNTMLETFSAK